MTWSCPYCGKPYNTEEEMNKCSCRGYHFGYQKTCPRCGGTGKIHPPLSSPCKCDHCNGTGKVQ